MKNFFQLQRKSATKTTTRQPSHRALGQIGRPLEALGAPADKTDPLDQPLLK